MVVTRRNLLEARGFSVAVPWHLAHCTRRLSVTIVLNRTNRNSIEETNVVLRGQIRLQEMGTLVLNFETWGELSEQSQKSEHSRPAMVKSMKRVEIMSTWKS